MRTRTFYDLGADRREVSLSINGDLLAKAEQVGLDPSKVAEQALASALAERQREIIREEIRQDVAWTEAYEAKHGSFLDMMREWQEEREAANAAEAV